MNSKLIVQWTTWHVNCLNCLFFTEPHRWIILILCYWGLKMIYDLRILARYQNIRKHELSPIDGDRWSSPPFKCYYRLTIDWPISSDDNRLWSMDFRTICFHPLFWGLFLKSPETFRVYFGCHNSRYIFATSPDVILVSKSEVCGWLDIAWDSS